MPPTSYAYAQIQIHPEARLAIRQVSLTNFRNYADLRLTPNGTSVVLTGANGSGKTNILEALSLLVPGRGLRRAELGEIQRHHAQSPWGVAIEIDTLFGSLKIGTGRDPATPENDRRIVQIDGQSAKSQNALAEHVVMTWITPDMDRVLAENAATRRKFLDRLVYAFDPSHSGRVQRYEKNMRERLTLLREGSKEITWLSTLEASMAQTGVAIAAARLQLLAALQDAIDETESIFPRATLAIKGVAEEKLQALPAILVEDFLRAAYAANRATDAENGTTAIGTHRSDLQVTHCAKNCLAEMCSTGEQKALLIAMTLAFVRTLTRARRVQPLLLLDDITAHLDSLRRDALFEEILHLGIQVWMTGTDAEPFKNFNDHSIHYHVNHGNITCLS